MKKKFAFNNTINFSPTTRKSFEIPAQFLPRDALAANYASQGRNTTFPSPRMSFHKDSAQKKNRNKYINSDGKHMGAGHLMDNDF